MTRYTLEHIAHALKEARKRKGLSQRALSQRSSLPQSQISKIENGAVDLRVSSLIELARALDQEVCLAPQTAIPAINAIVRRTEFPVKESTPSKEWRQFLNAIAAKSAKEPEHKAYAQIQNYLKEIWRSSPETENNLKYRMRVNTLNHLLKKLDDEKETQNFLVLLRNWRSELAHSHAEASETENIRPAYILDESYDG